MEFWRWWIVVHLWKKVVFLSLPLSYCTPRLLSLQYLAKLRKLWYWAIKERSWATLTRKQSCRFKLLKRANLQFKLSGLRKDITRLLLIPLAQRGFDGTQHRVNTMHPQDSENSNKISSNWKGLAPLEIVSSNRTWSGQWSDQSAPDEWHMPKEIHEVKHYYISLCQSALISCSNHPDCYTKWTRVLSKSLEDRKSLNFSTSIDAEKCFPLFFHHPSIHD